MNLRSLMAVHSAFHGSHRASVFQSAPHPRHSASRFPDLLHLLHSAQQLILVTSLKNESATIFNASAIVG